MTGSAGNADQERWLDRPIGEMAHAGIDVLFLARKLAVITFPARETSVQIPPAFGIEAWIRELSKSQCAGRRTEREVARGLSLVGRAVMNIIAVGGRLFEI